MSVVTIQKSWLKSYIFLYFVHKRAMKKAEFSLKAEDWHLCWCVFLVMLANFGKDRADKLRKKKHAKHAFRVCFHTWKIRALKVLLREWYPAWNTSSPLPPPGPEIIAYLWDNNHGMLLSPSHPICPYTALSRCVESPGRSTASLEGIGLFLTLRSNNLTKW